MLVYEILVDKQRNQRLKKNQLKLNLRIQQQTNECGQGKQYFLPETELKLRKPSRLSRAHST